MKVVYDLYSDFDIEMHRKTFVAYLEVIINDDGKVMYAVPSHQEKLIALSCEKLGVTRAELNSMCPREYYFDFMRWLCKISGAMAVWNGKCEFWEPTVKQIGMLRKLKMAGLYEGSIPNTSEMRGEKYSNVQFYENY